MKSDIQTLQIARMLECEAAEFTYLGRLTPAQRATLRRQLEVHLHGAGEPALGQLAGASALVPAALAARIVQRVLGPLVTAMLAHRVPHERAVAIMAHLAPDYLAEVAQHLCAEDCAELIEQIPAAHLEAVIEALRARGDHLTIAALLAHLQEAVMVRICATLDAEVLAELLMLAADPLRLAEAARDTIPEQFEAALARLPRPLADPLASRFPA